MKLDKLTPEQEAILPVKRDEWIKAGLSTEPANRPEAERGVRLAYEAAGLPAPRFIIWLDSPYAGAFGQAITPGVISSILGSAQVGAQVWDQVGAQVRAQVRDQVRAQVGDQVWAQVGDQVGAQVRDQVRAQVGDQVWDQVGDQVGAQVWAQVWDQVRAQVGDQVWDQVGDQVGAQVGDQVGAQVGDQVGDQVRDQVRAQVGDQVWAQVGDQVGAQVRDQVRAQVGDQVWDQVRAQVRDQVRAQVRDQVRAQVRDQVWAQVRRWHEACVYDYWTIYYSAWFDTVRTLGVQNLEQWAGMELVGRNAYWFWTFRGFAILTQRPRELHRDPEGRLHNEKGAAISWPDGWGFYAWHGVRVPAWVITEPTVDRAIREENSEIRRAAFERIGWENAIDDLVKDYGARLLDVAADPGNAPHMLELYELPERIYDEPVNLLLMVNGSPDRSGAIRRYGETCPASITNPLEAAAWQYGVPVETYRLVERRS